MTRKHAKQQEGKRFQVEIDRMKSECKAKRKKNSRGSDASLQCMRHTKQCSGIDVISSVRLIIVSIH